MDIQVAHADTPTRIHPEADAMEQTVLQWLADQTPLLWVPVIDVENFPGALQAAQESARDLDGGWLTLQQSDFLRLPEGIKGWLLPINGHDTDVDCRRWEQEIFFLRVRERATGAVVTYRTDVSSTLPVS